MTEVSLSRSSIQRGQITLTIEVLPDDLLKYIYGFFAELSDQLSFTQVCMRFRAVTLSGAKEGMAKGYLQKIKTQAQAVQDVFERTILYMDIAQAQGKLRLFADGRDTLDEAQEFLMEQRENNSVSSVIGMQIKLAKCWLRLRSPETAVELLREIEESVALIQDPEIATPLYLQFLTPYWHAPDKKIELLSLALITAAWIQDHDLFLRYCYEIVVLIVASLQNNINQASVDVIIIMASEAAESQTEGMSQRKVFEKQAYLAKIFHKLGRGVERDAIVQNLQTRISSMQDGQERTECYLILFELYKELRNWHAVGESLRSASEAAERIEDREAKDRLLGVTAEKQADFDDMRGVEHTISKIEDREERQNAVFSFVKGLIATQNLATAQITIANQITGPRQQARAWLHYAKNQLELDRRAPALEALAEAQAVRVDVKDHAEMAHLWLNAAEIEYDSNSEGQRHLQALIKALRHIERIADPEQKAKFSVEAGRSVVRVFGLER